MQKTAQDRGILDWVSEKTNPGGIAAESAPFFNNPGFKEVMDDLRKADDKARAIAMGTSEGADSDNMSLKDLLKEAESAINRREYLKGAAFLSKFHKNIGDIVAVFDNFSLSVADIHDRFLLEGLDPKTKKDVLKERSRLEEAAKKRLEQYAKSASVQNGMVKQAGVGVSDFFINLLTNRGRALAAWEKRYPGTSFGLKESSISMLNESKNVFKSLVAHFKEMSKARNKRMVEKWEQSACGQKGSITSLWAPFDAKFHSYYEKNVKKWADRLAKQSGDSPEEAAAPGSTVSVPDLDIKPGKIPAATTTEEEDGDEEGGVDLDDPRAQAAAQAAAEAAALEAKRKQLAMGPDGRPLVQTNISKVQPGAFFGGSPIGKQHFQVGVPGTTAVTPQRLSEREKEEARGKVFRNTLKPFDPSAQLSQTILPPKKPEPSQLPLFPTATQKNIIETLESLANESPILIKSYLSKYASILNASEPETAKKLVDIINRIGS